MSKAPFIFLLSFLLSWSCQRPDPSTYEQIETVLSQELAFQQLGDYDTLMILSDKGACLTCNQRFFKIAENLNNRKKTLFIVSANPLKIDISAFLIPKSEHIILDPERHFESLNLLKSSGLIVLKEGEAVEITEIGTKNIDEAPTYFPGLYSIKQAPSGPF